MANVSVTERINAPVNNIFRVMTDIGSWSEMISGITKVEIVSEDKTFQKGLRWKETRLMFGKESTEEMWVTECIPNQKYVIESECMGSHFSTSFLFKKIDNYTTDIVMDMNIKATTFMAKLMSPLCFFMKGTLKKCIVNDIDDCRKVCMNMYDEDTSSSVKIRPHFDSKKSASKVDQ